MKRVFTARLFE